MTPGTLPPARSLVTSRFVFEIVLSVGVVVLFALGGYALFRFGFTGVVHPDQVVVLSGRRSIGPDGRACGYRVVKGGMYTRFPILERADVVSLAPFSIRVEAIGKSGAVYGGRDFAHFNRSGPYGQSLELGVGQDGDRNPTRGRHDRPGRTSLRA